MQQMIALPIIFIGTYIIITLLIAVFPFGRHTYQSVEDFCKFRSLRPIVTEN